jgi:signal transduction histidine kinase
MLDITLETVRTLVLLAILVFLLRIGRNRFKESRKGWNLILTGFALLTFGSFVDITDNFESLNSFVVIGDTEVEAVLEKFIGFLGGFIALAIGLVLWLPSVQRLSDEITERKRTTDALRDREAQLQQAQKMEAVGQLTGGIAHDFNNLLTVIIGNLKRIGDKVADDGKTHNMIERALRAAERGASLTHRLLAFSRKQALIPSEIDLNELASDMTNMLSRILGETTEIHVVETADLWRCRADRAQLESALLNLAINSRDAMPEGGTLTIRTANVTLGGGEQAAHAEAAPGDYVMLEVSDTGTGIPPDVLPQVFEPFFTTKDVGQGSGLGLSMIYGFAKQSGGDATIESELGRGTIIQLYLPRAAAQEDSRSADQSGQDLAHSA